MVRPVNFRMNEQTAVNNYYQEHLKGFDNYTINQKAQFEFDMFVDKLRAIGVNVFVIDDRIETDTPDSIFPNNWISFHANGNIGIYPMFAENRRLERRYDILDMLENEGFKIDSIVDYTTAEAHNMFLEGTGSIVLDRVNRKAYCALSPRADEDLFIEFCEDFEFTPVIFVANQTVGVKRKPIYHTNVMMCIAETFAIICLDSIDNKGERQAVLKHLKEDNKEVIKISENQITDFAGNMLQVKGNNDERYLVMSQSAYDSLTPIQIESIEKHCKILFSPLNTIEVCGGGSARCMMAEIFLPRLH